MLDPKFIRENIEQVKQAAKHKGIRFDAELFLQVSDKRSAQIEVTETLRRARNEGADQVKACKDKEQREQLIVKMREVNQRLTDAEGGLREIEQQFDKLLFQVPSIPSADTPIGASDADNVEWRKWSEPRSFSFAAKDHMELGEKLKLVDFKRATQIAGSRSYFLTGLGAELERAVHSLAFDLLKSRAYQAMSVPVLVKTSAMQGTGYLPGGEDQAYHVEKDEMWLVGTSEVPLASFLADEILDSQTLPIKIFAHSSCFRREAGAHGKDTKGLYRVHQFQKIEQVVICEPNWEASEILHTELLKNAEDLLQMLELPYRVVKVCTGDLGQGQVKKHDVETWMPSRNSYGETHSCSSFGDYQARRLKIRTKDANGRSQFVFTLNNTLAATPRLLIPLFENHQTEDGGILIPKALQKYMGGLQKIEAKAT